MKNFIFGSFLTICLVLGFQNCAPQFDTQSQNEQLFKNDIPSDAAQVKIQGKHFESSAADEKLSDDELVTKNIYFIEFGYGLASLSDYKYSMNLKTGLVYDRQMGKQVSSISKPKIDEIKKVLNQSEVRDPFFIFPSQSGYACIMLWISPYARLISDAGWTALTTNGSPSDRCFGPDLFRGSTREISLKLMIDEILDGLQSAE